MLQSKLPFLHIHTIAALYSGGGADALDMVLQGGAGLRLGYASPRASEDLDFLVKRQAGLRAAVDALMRRTRDAVAAAALLNFGQQNLVLKNNGRNAREHNPLVYELRLPNENRSTPDDVLKIEFFAVRSENLSQYGRSIRAVRDPLYPHLSPLVPVADLREVLVDKLHAIASRPYLKYRDVFDLWWLAQQGVTAEPAAFAAIENHLAMYSGDEAKTPYSIARSACARLETAAVLPMRRELSRFLPAVALSGQALVAMIEKARDTAAGFAEWAAPPPRAGMRR